MLTAGTGTTKLSRTHSIDWLSSVSEDDSSIAAVCEVFDMTDRTRTSAEIYSKLLTCTVLAATSSQSVSVQYIMEDVMFSLQPFEQVLFTL